METLQKSTLKGYDVSTPTKQRSLKEPAANPKEMGMNERHHDPRWQ
jgi:hypothetical protein